jgi:hypothetical protein
VNIFHIDCEHVISEISNYIDGEVATGLREQIAAHVAGCTHCYAILNGTRNTLSSVADARVFDLPDGFADRLYRKLKDVDGPQ